MTNLGSCKIKELDDIFYSTKHSHGHENALAAIKYVLFDHDSMFVDSDPEENKYLYISKENNARKKAMLLQSDDLIQIITKLCMASFGLRGKDFNVTEDSFILDLKRIERLDISEYEAIELVSYAAMTNINNVYVIFDSNKDIYLGVVDYLLNERYSSVLIDQLDNFSGIIDNNDMKSDLRFKFYDAYNNLDDVFAEIKKNNPDYIK
jgi:hypothetical protein